jgi:SAM-dependent methyltransferase
MPMPGRLLVPELMDDPALAPGPHQRALRGLARINRLSAAPDTLWNVIRTHALASASAAPGRPIPILDIATGSGDVPLRLVRLAAGSRPPIALEPTLCDASATALDATRDRAARLGVGRFHIRRADVVADGLPFDDGAFSIVTCSLFLHHLEREACVGLLREMARVAGPLGLVVVSDLRRCAVGLVGAWLAGRLLTRSSIVRVDAVRSVRAALTPSELLTLAREAGLTDPARLSVSHAWPWRMILRWGPA